MSNELQTQQPRQISPIEDFRSSINKMESQIKACLPAHVPVERFTRVVMTAIQKSPSLLGYDRNSLFAACLSAAADGLLPDGKEAALVPYKGVVTYTPMVSGIMKKMRNSGEILSICADVVKKNDEFDYYTDEKGKHLKHRPKIGDRGETIASYAMIITKDDGVYMEVMDIGQLENIRKRSPFGDKGPWASDRDEMYKKTAIRRTSKMAPTSTDIDGMFQKDDEASAIIDKIESEPSDKVHIAPAATPKQQSKLSNVIAAKPAQAVTHGMPQATPQTPQAVAKKQQPSASTPAEEKPFNFDPFNNPDNEVPI